MALPLTIQIMPLMAAAGFIITCAQFFIIGLLQSRGRDALVFWKKLKIEPSNVLGGLCCGTINVTTNSSYMLHGASLVTMLLLMRGGMMMMGPPADAVSGRQISRGTWAAFCVALGAFACGLAGAGGVPALGFGILILYLAAYATNFSLFGKKQGDFEWLCSTQLVACGSQLIVSTLMSTFTSHMDFTSFGDSVMLQAFLVGAMAQLTGIFGPMILMAPDTEQTFSAALNRSGAMISGVTASVMLGAPLSFLQMSGVALFISAIVLLFLTKRAVQRREMRVKLDTTPQLSG